MREMSNKEKLENIEALASYLVDCVHSGEVDEHYLPIYKAQTSNDGFTLKDDDYLMLVMKLYEWADETLRAL